MFLGSLCALAMAASQEVLMHPMLFRLGWDPGLMTVSQMPGCAEERGSPTEGRDNPRPQAAQLEFLL